MEKDDRITEFVARLNRLTKENLLKWIRVPESVLKKEGTDSVYDNLYNTDINNREIGIFEERYREYSPETNSFYWDKRTILGLFDSRGNLQYEFRDVPGLIDLMRTIKYHAAKVDEFLDEFLKEKIKFPE